MKFISLRAGDPWVTEAEFFILFLFQCKISFPSLVVKSGEKGKI
jgi:hypothetical protein